MSDDRPDSLGEPGWLTFAQAVTYTGLGNRTLRRYAAEGKLPTYRLGTQLLRIKRADLDALLVPVSR